MSDVIDIPKQAPIRFVPRAPRLRWPRRRRRDRPPKPKVRKLRLLLALSGLGALAFVSTVFGMMMAVASDLPQLENRAQYQKAANSFLYDDHWRPIGLFAPPNNVVIDRFQEISPYVRRAIVAIEDRRFWSNPGVDIRGIGRAFLADITGGARQGASTIAQQFVKNALIEQNNRTVFEKLREAALAYHLTRKWSKEQILREYLNSIYFGSGAYGIESAARVYFGKAHGYNVQAGSASTDASGVTTSQAESSSGCGDNTNGTPRPKCAFVLHPWEAALLAGMVASPSAFDPIAHPSAAQDRRNVVLKNMFDDGELSRRVYRESIAAPLPKPIDIQQPEEPTSAPYFTSWLRPQILAAMGLGRGVPANVAEYRAYYGGLKIRTSLDLDMQRAAEQAVRSELPPGAGLPDASLVAIDNKTGEVRAMVGGESTAEDYAREPFNVATEGHRQPGSSFKPFTLAVALESGYGPYSLLTSAPADFIVPHSAGKEHFIVHNFGNAYSGTISLANATAFSDNSAYARLGIEGLGKHGTRRIARMAGRLGIRSHISSNYAMILGGLREGVTPLDMAHAYETFATGGLRVYNLKLGAPLEGPTGISQINCPVCHGHSKAIFDRPAYKRVLPPAIAKEVHDILTGPVRFGTATNAQISGVDVAGKTGTTSNYGDAWFVGWTPQITTAVWVGYPTRLESMSTSYNGSPVEGGTYPAIIWQSFMSQALQIFATEQAAHAKPSNGSTTTTSTTSTDSVGVTTPTDTSSAPAPSTGTGGSTGGAGGGTTGSGTGGGTTGGVTGGGGTGGGTTGGGTTSGGTTGGGTTGGGTGGGGAGGGTGGGGTGGGGAGGGTGGTGGAGLGGGGGGG